MNFKFKNHTISFSNYEKQEAELGLPELYYTEDFIVVNPEGREVDSDQFMNSLNDKEYHQFWRAMDTEIRNYLWYYRYEI